MSIQYPIEYSIEHNPVPVFKMRLYNWPSTTVIAIEHGQWKQCADVDLFIRRMQDHVSWYTAVGVPLPSELDMEKVLHYDTFQWLYSNSLAGYWIRPRDDNWDNMLRPSLAGCGITAYTKTQSDPFPVVINQIEPVTLTLKCQHALAKFERMTLVCPTCGIVGGI